MRKNVLLLSSVATFSLISFFGCGGESTSTVSSKVETNKKEVTGFTSSYTAGKASKNFKLLLDQILPIQGSYAIFKEVDQFINQNQPINLTLEYNNISATLYHAILKSDGIPIGENFIYINTGRTKQKIELLAQLIDTQLNVSKYNIEDRTYSRLKKIWNKAIDKSIIIDSLKNNSFNALQNSKYTVNFTFQKTANQDLQFSNIKISGLNLMKDHFVLRADQFNSYITLLTLQSLLTTLFANFDKSKAIFK